MKKIAAVALFWVATFMYTPANAQVNATINLGKQPAWGPTGYSNPNYYYLPDIDVFYDVPRRQFIYPNGNQWVFANSLPASYANYNLYNGYKVVVNDRNPYNNADIYRVKYKKYKGWKGPKQVVLRDHDNRYKKNGPSYNTHKDNGNGKNKGKGNGNGNGKGKSKGKS